MGSGVFADSLAKTLAGQGVDVERADSASAATTADVLLPDLLVLAADAAQSRGAPLLAQLQAAGRATPTLVICAAELASAVPSQAPLHVAYIAPKGGAIDAARCVRALLVALTEDPSSGSSLQQLADRAARPLSAAGPSAAPGAQLKSPARAKTQPGVAVPLTASGSKAAEQIPVRDAGVSSGALKPGEPLGAAKPVETAPLRETARPKKPALQPNNAAGGRTPTAHGKSVELSEIAPSKKPTTLNNLAGGRTPIIQTKSAETVTLLPDLKATAPLKIHKASAAGTQPQANKLHATSQVAEPLKGVPVVAAFKSTTPSAASTTAAKKPNDASEVASTIAVAGAPGQLGTPPSASQSPLSAATTGPQKGSALGQTSSHATATQSVGAARTATTQPLVQKPAAPSAATPARATTTQPLVPKPSAKPAAFSSVSPARELVQQPSAAGTSAQPRAMSAAQAALVLPSAAAAPSQAERPLPQPAAAGADDAAERRVDFAPNAASPALLRSPPANDRLQPTVPNKTMPGAAPRSAKQANAVPTAPGALSDVASSAQPAQTAKQAESVQSSQVKDGQPQTSTTNAANGGIDARATGPLPAGRAATKPATRQTAATPVAASAPLATTAAAARTPLESAAQSKPTTSALGVQRTAAASALQPVAAAAHVTTPAVSAPTTSALAASLASAVGGATHIELRASEVELSIGMSDAPPAPTELAARDRDASLSDARLAAAVPPTLPTPQKGPQTKPALEQPSSDLEAQQVIDIDVALSDRPASLAAPQLSAASDVVLAPGAGAPAAKPAQRIEPARQGTRPLPMPTNLGSAGPHLHDAQPVDRARGMDPQPASAATNAAAGVSLNRAARAPTHSFDAAAHPAPQPTAAPKQAAVPGAEAPSRRGGRTQAYRIEPAAHADEPATNASDASGPSAAPAHAPRQPLDAAARTAQPTTSAGGPSAAPGRAPRHPFDPAPRTAQPTTSAGGPSAAPGRAPRHPFDPAPRTAQPTTSAGGPSAAPGRAPRHPFDPAPRTAQPQISASGPSRAPGRPPRYPFEPAARTAEPQISANVVTARPPRYPFEPAPYAERQSANVVTARPPRYPFEPAARPTDPQISANVVTARPPQYALEPAARAAEPPPLAAKRTGAMRAKRVPTLPFEPANAQPRAANAAATEQPRTLLEASPALLEATLSTSKPRRTRSFWVVGAVAAISCSVLLLYRTYDGSAAAVPGNAATGALSQTPALAVSPEPIALDHAPPAQVPAASAPAIESSERGAPTATAESRAGGPRRAGSAREPDLTTAAGRARALVDTGSAMLREGRLGLAESNYMKALQEVPEYPAAMAELVRVHLARKDGMEAVRWADRLVNKQNNALHQLLLGDAQALRGNSGAAQAAWTKAADGGNAIARERLSDDE